MSILLNVFMILFVFLMVVSSPRLSFMWWTFWKVEASRLAFSVSEYAFEFVVGLIKGDRVFSFGFFEAACKGPKCIFVV